MTDSTGNPSMQPGWYADPAGSPRQRWWDGAAWTEHLHDPSLQIYGATAKPPVGPQTPVYNVFIWVIVTLPVLSILALFAWDVTGYMARSVSSGLSAVLDPTWLLLMLLSGTIYLGTATLAFFDWRQLGRDGFAAPFHWAWVLLSSGLYVIGRSVIVRRRAGRGLAPIWVWAAIVLVALVVALVKVADAMSLLMRILPSYP